MKYTFINGLILNEGYYFDVIKQLLYNYFPNLTYSAGLIGYGSDVLGFDTHISMDHNWGPRLILFLSNEDLDIYKDKINELLKEKLPYEYKGFPTNYTKPGDDKTQRMERIDSGKVNHMIEITSISDFLCKSINIKSIDDIKLIDWLKFTDVGLIELTKGKIFHDGLNNVNIIRNYFKFYPNEILKLKLASLWNQIASEQAFIGRNIDIGEEVGVRIIASRIVKTLMKICFYIEKQYIPYSKWFSKGFEKLNCYSLLIPLFKEIMTCVEINNLDYLICNACKEVIKLQNRLYLFDEIDLEIKNYYDRPYKVIDTNVIIEKLLSSINDESLRKVKLDYISILNNIDGIDLTDNMELIDKILS